MLISYHDNCCQTSHYSHVVPRHANGAILHTNGYHKLQESEEILSRVCHSTTNVHSDPGKVNYDNISAVSKGKMNFDHVFEDELGMISGYTHLTLESIMPTAVVSSRVPISVNTKLAQKVSEHIIAKLTSQQTGSVAWQLA